MGRATEHSRTASRSELSGLLNLAFGNAADYLIALFFLKGLEEELSEASLTINHRQHSACAWSTVAGGAKFSEQTTRLPRASTTAALTLAAVR